ncbi:unnamed protein product [Penicillium roqueforti FM164]|uniref:Uncharacterized protein n=1 Tax=Penicillium roqueforti (strain FM164) TaxID=1365484 RepID=W6QKM5_PENRF|nr:unnamed protein product [Penicillium roqueforti FM164]
MQLNIVDCINKSLKWKREKWRNTSFSGSGDIAHWTWTSDSMSLLYFHSTYDYRVQSKSTEYADAVQPIITILASIPATPEPTRPPIPSKVFNFV